jgi:hypothetical protein
MANSSERRLLYGRLDDFQLVFIPEDRAHDLVKVRDAIENARTWGEFRLLLPERRWREIADDYAPVEEEPPPADDEPFAADAVPGYIDGDWPEWPAQQMLDWMPQDIQDRFGDVGSSMVSGDSLYIDPASERDVVAALQNAGYVCSRDDKLVARASGH